MTRIPASRRLVTAVGRASRSLFAIQGLIEVDVTEARRLIRDDRARGGDAFSFTAFLVACVAKAVAEDRERHAYRDWRGRLVTFHDVDVLTMIEVDTEAGSFPIAHVVRAADKLTLREVHDDLRRAQARPLGTREGRLLRWGRYLPLGLAGLALRVVNRSPVISKRLKGTVSVTSIGMFGRRGGWGLALPSHPVGVVVGGISRKPGFVGERVEAREYVHLTLAFDHAVTDGAPAARFTERFARRVENATGLAEALAHSRGSGERHGTPESGN